MSSRPLDASASLVRRLIHYARPRQLQLVARMAELGSIQKAADAMGLSQPSATQALSRIEALLGLAIFDRHARGIRLTREGELIMPALIRSLAALERLGRDAVEVTQGAKGLVRIAGIAAASTAVVAAALPPLCAARPDLWVEYQEIEAADIPALCNEDGADIVLCRMTLKPPSRYVMTRLRDDELGVYCSKDHPLAKRREIDTGAFAAALWLEPPVDSPPHRAFEAFCKRRDFEPLLARAISRTLPVNVALVCHLKLLHIGLQSHMQPYVDAGQLKRLAVDVAGPREPIGLLHLEHARTEAVDAAIRHLQAWDY